MQMIPAWVNAGFLEMPEVTELPEIQRKSMLKDLDIPSVRDRNPDPEAGPRLNVIKFKLQGIVEYPELGITKADIDKLIEEVRFDLMREYDLRESGFTEAETDDVTKLLVEIEEDTMDRHVSTTDLQRLVWLVREQREQRGITLGQIEAVADKITQFYRSRGFILAKAYIPEQEVREGIVSLTLLLGVLGDVVVQEKESSVYVSDDIRPVFNDLLARPVTSSEIEEKLYLVNDFPGLAVVGYFEPGGQVGDTTLQLKISKEEPYSGMLRLDNHGSSQTGEYRLYGEVLFNNLAGISDQLNIGLLSAFSPDNANYGQIRYTASLFSPRFYFSTGFSTNQFVLGQGADESLNRLDLSGDTRSMDLSLMYKIQRSRVFSHSVSLEGNNVVSELESGYVPLDGFLDDEVDIVSIKYAFDSLDEADKVLHQGEIMLRSGELFSQFDSGKETEFNILAADYTFFTFWTIPFTEVSTRLLSRASLQYTQESLSSIVQRSLAGPAQVKAFPINTFSADSALYIGVEWIFDKPTLFDFHVYGDASLNDLLQPYLFLDAAYGNQKSLVASEEDLTATLAGAGLGVRLNYQSDFSANFSLAYPVQETYSSDAVELQGDGARLVFDMQFMFR
ncbi:MAG: ShlB/FhaC/HecB family hemolysin secretion/activation protein [Gammaproteobacteria bacterium]|nr:ShlB/FhaC/HecB family hemolysin secretion/activation protein [Gammaproteobacteria bacterium]